MLRKIAVLLMLSYALVACGKKAEAPISQPVAQVQRLPSLPLLPRMVNKVDQQTYPDMDKCKAVMEKNITAIVNLAQVRRFVPEPGSYGANAYKANGDVDRISCMVLHKTSGVLFVDFHEIRTIGVTIDNPARFERPKRTHAPTMSVAPPAP